MSLTGTRCALYVQKDILHNYYTQHYWPRLLPHVDLLITRRAIVVQVEPLRI